MLSTEQFKASKRYLDFFLQASYTSLYLPIPPHTSLYLPCISLQVSFALVPPVSFGGGWPAFFVSLGFIAIMTVIVGDLAGLFGCVCGLEPEPEPEPEPEA